MDSYVQSMALGVSRTRIALKYLPGWEKWTLPSRATLLMALTISPCTFLQSSTCCKTLPPASANFWSKQRLTQITPTSSASPSSDNTKSCWTTRAIRSASSRNPAHLQSKLSINSLHLTQLPLLPQTWPWTGRIKFTRAASQSVEPTRCRPAAKLCTTRTRGTWLCLQQIAPIAQTLGSIKLVPTLSWTRNMKWNLLA